jgi:hypothetical protein
VATALAAFRERLSPVAELPADRALTALAFAEAPGLTAGLWQLAIEAIDGTRVSAADLTRFARSAAANFLVEAGNQASAEAHGAGGGAVYRLFHQALNDALLHSRSDVMPRADDERALTLALIEHGRQSSWNDAPDYLLRSLPGHAAAVGLADDLLCDDHYLLHADLRRLIQAAGQAGSALGRRRAPAHPADSAGHHSGPARARRPVQRYRGPEPPGHQLPRRLAGSLPDRVDFGQAPPRARLPGRPPGSGLRRVPGHRGRTGAAGQRRR